MVGSIAAPWAVDASGNAVPTSFEVAGNTVTQVVEHAGAVYPVTADPLFTFGRSIYVNITGAQAIGVKNLFTAVAIGGVAAGCSRAFQTALSKAGSLGSLAAALVSGLCLYGGKDAVQALISSLNDPAGFDPGACYQKDIFNGAEGFVQVGASNCQ